jgi:PAS domain S-box-containing protein
MKNAIPSLNRVSQKFAFAASGLILVTGITFDLSVPLGVAAGIPHVLAVLIGIWFPKKRYVIFVAVLGSLFTVAGYFLSASGSDNWIVLTNRGLALILIWGAAFVVCWSLKINKELDNSKVKMSLASEASKSGFWARNIATSEVFWSDENAKLLGYKPGEVEPCYENWAARLHPDDRQHAEAVYQECIDNEMDLDVEYRVLLPNGRTRWIANRGKVVINEDDGTTSFTGIQIDITERKHTETQLLNAKDEAEKANHAKSQFLASMSHELRTPLNAIMGFSQVMQYDLNDPLSHHQKENIDYIAEAGDRLLELVNSILDLATVESKRAELSIEAMDLSLSISECTELATAIGHKRNITVTNDLDEHERIVVNADRHRLKQVVNNLLKNAIVFNADGGSVTISVDEKQSGLCRISITDTGVGIAKEDHPGVFNMFERIGADSLIAREGTGIGLTVSKLLVERMSGRIGFESEKDVGSTFWIELPMIQERAEFDGQIAHAVVAGDRSNMARLN